MILFFSGTGNSHFVAEKIAQTTGDEVVSINERLKNNDTTSLTTKTESFVFVSPTYAWQLPREVIRWITRTTFEGGKQAYFVLTCGGETCNAIAHTRKLAHAKGWALHGFVEIVLPDNYIVMFPSVEEQEAKAHFAKALPLIQQTSEAILGDISYFHYPTPVLRGKLKSAVVNAMFYTLYVHAKGFYANEKCIGCGQCVQNCPLNNIRLQQNKPAWHANCTHCMACICKCPTEAIEYKTKTQGKFRYVMDAAKYVAEA